MQPHAAAIRALPHARHPRLSAAVEALAAEPFMTVETARRVLDAACRGAGISGLDIEMCQPGAAAAVPFVPASSASPAAAYDEGVAAIVRQRIEGARR